MGGFDNITTEGRRRALSSREPWNRGNRTAHGFHGSRFHGSAVEPWAGTVVDGHGSAVEPWAGTVAHGSTAQPWNREL